MSRTVNWMAQVSILAGFLCAGATSARAAVDPPCDTVPTQGGARGLCVAYYHGLGCNTSTAQTPTACAAVAANYLQVTGQDITSLSCYRACPSFCNMGCPFDYGCPPNPVNYCIPTENGAPVSCTYQCQ